MLLNFNNYSKYFDYNIDNYTLEHMKRVGELSLALAETMCLDNIEIIYTAARLHDIGKTLVNKNILNKSGPLTEDEFLHMKMHVIHSTLELFKKGYSVDVIKNVLFHHENFDGTGYPCKLKGDEIPVGARIIRICDTFDALTSDRPYRKSLNINKALAIMESEIGNYDPEIFSIFLNMIDVKEDVK